MKRFSSLLALFLAQVLLAVPALAAAENSYYYSQLDADGQDAYNMLLANRSALAGSGTVSISKPGFSRTQASHYMNSSVQAVKAINYDHPEIFWLSDWTTRAAGDNGGYTITLDFSFSDSWDSRHGTRSIPADESALNAQVSALAAQARSAGPSRYDQLAYVHDWLTHNNIYNEYAARLRSPIGDSTPWEAISALDASLSPVCEGYSRAFKLVCDELGIPCVLVSGMDHMWNCVQMEDGQWYAVDATYDDPVYSVNGVPQNKPESGGENRKYFLVGRQGFGDHAYDREWSYPALSAVNYDANTAPAAPAEPVPAEPAPVQPVSVIPESPVVTVTPAGPVTPVIPSAVPAAPTADPTASTASSWAQGEVSNAIYYGLVPVSLQSGYQRNITRAEFANLAVTLMERTTGYVLDDLMAHLGLTAVAPFQDTGDRYVAAAYVLGIVTGRSKTVFDPNGSITRQEAAAMLARSAHLMGAPISGSAKNFSDSALFAPWAVEAIAYVSSIRTPGGNKAVMGGVGSKQFDPFGTYTREQAIITSLRLFEALGFTGMGW